MNNYHSINNKTVVYCTRCMNKLRVPVDKGKIAVVCPVCRKEFVYSPDSILHTLKHAVLSVVAFIPKNRRKQVLLLIAALILIAALLFFFAGRSHDKGLNQNPGPMVYLDNYQK